MPFPHLGGGGSILRLEVTFNAVAEDRNQRNPDCLTATTSEPRCSCFGSFSLKRGQRILPRIPLGLCSPLLSFFSLQHRQLWEQSPHTAERNARFSPLSVDVFYFPILFQPLTRSSQEQTKSCCHYKFEGRVEPRRSDTIYLTENK